MSLMTMPLCFFLFQGGRIGKDVKVGSNPVKLAWHPNKPILAAGWEDGAQLPLL